MGIGVGQMLDEIRGMYCQRLTASFAAGVPMSRVLSEVVLRDAEGRPGREGTLGLPLRMDVVTLIGGVPTESTSVACDKILSFKPFSFDWGDSLRVEVTPFQWDDMVLRFRHTRFTGDWGPLLRWFRNWFREDEDGDGTTLLGVVHFLSDPHVEGEWTELFVDLGSAPVKAFEDLLDAVEAVGADEVRIGRAA